jgi:hypothetical protein
MTHRAQGVPEHRSSAGLPIRTGQLRFRLASCRWRRVVTIGRDNSAVVRFPTGKASSFSSISCCEKRRELGAGPNTKATSVSFLDLTLLGQRFLLHFVGMGEKVRRRVPSPVWQWERGYANPPISGRPSV